GEGGRAAVDIDEEEQPDEEGSIIGSAQYMAPEQAWGDNTAIDARTDVFALGGLLYQLLTGYPPYRATTPAEVLHLARLGMVDPPDAAYILTSGRAVAYAMVDGEKRVLREMGPGEVFGEMALLADRPRTASVAAVDDVTTIVVTAEALARELHSESWLAALVH